MTAGASGQGCKECGKPLSRYNTSQLCQGCTSAGRSVGHHRQPGDNGPNPIDGENLARLRRERGLTQEMLAERAGLSAVIVRKLEQNAKRSARVSTLAALASVLQVPASSLLVGRSDRQDQPMTQEAGNALEDIPGRPTLLRALIEQRHWQRFRTFQLQFQRAAQELAEREGDPDLAKLTISSRQWERWYSGEVKTEPFPDACRVLEHMFGHPIRQLLAVCDEAADGLWDVVADSAGPGSGSMLGTPDTALPLKGLSEDVVDILGRIQKLHQGTIHPEIISQLQENARQTVSEYERLGHPSLVPSLIKRRAFMEVLLGECRHPAQQRQLFEITALISGVLGYVAVGRGNFPLARAYTLEAFQLGDFAGDTNLQAWARGLQSFCEYYAGRYDSAVALAQDGLTYAQAGPQSVRLAINGVARAQGKLGDAVGVDRAVGESYDLLERNDAPQGVPSSIALGCYSAAQTASNAATAYVSLRMADKTQHYVDLALPEISMSDSPWSRSLVMIDLALSLVRSDKGADLDNATQLVLDALSISAGRPIISVQQRTAEFVRDAVNRWGLTPQVRAILDATAGQ
jgi:DNA-binding XRE family transcriptional regulator